MAKRETTLGGFLIEEGSVVAPSVLNVHMNEAIWGEDAKVRREGGREGGREGAGICVDTWHWKPVDFRPPILLSLPLCLTQVFRPSRWTENGGGLEARLPKGAYIPFGMGPRVCLGMRLALAESMVVLTILLKTVKFSVKEGRSLDVRYPGAATFKGGVKVVVEGMRG